jgi:O-antigen/teichoic acid export membrane protein
LFLSNAFWLFVEKLSRSLFFLFLIYFYANNLPANVFGEFSYSKSFLSLLASLTYLGLSGHIVKELVLDRESECEIIGSTIFLKFLFGVFLFIVLIFVQSFHLSTDRLLILAVVTSPAFIHFSDVFEFYFQANTRGVVLGRSRLLSCFFATSYLWLCWYFKLNIIFLFLTIFVESLIFLFLIMQVFKKDIPFKSLTVSLPKIKKLLVISAPLMISGFFAQANLKMDQIMIREILGAEYVAVYAVCANIIDPISLLALVFMTAVFPHLMKIKDSKLILNEFFEVQKVVTLVGFLIVGFLFIFADRIVLGLFGYDYVDSIKIMKIHSVSVIFLFWSQVYFKWVFVFDLYKFTILSHGGGSLLNIALNYLLLPKFGVLSASYTTVLSYFFSFSLILVFYSKTRELAFMQLKSLFFCLNLKRSLRWISSLR